MTHPTPQKLPDWKTEFLEEYHKEVDRLITLQILPNLQSNMSERIPDLKAFKVYDGRNLLPLIRSLLENAREETKDSYKEWLEEMLESEPMYELEKVKKLVEDAIDAEYQAMESSL